MKTRALGVFTVLFLSLAAGAAGDSSESEGLLNKLLAPGPLMMGHAKLEKADCLECHAPRKGVPDEKCNKCHKEIEVQVTAHRGFHGLANQSCVKCHSDHHGRDYDSTRVDPQTFDHSKTGYVLEGKHSKIKCQECHQEKRSKWSKVSGVLRPNEPHYFGLKSSCVSCHKKDDVHKFQGKWAKKDCSECHGMKTWKEDLKFDHKRDAKYELVGKHSELKCSECHNPKGKTPKYQWPRLKKELCLSCHQDQHAGKLGPRFSGGDCTKCHGQKEWKISHFDHSITQYPLRGKHSELQCKDCHIQKAKDVPVKNFVFKGLKQNCVSCHKDIHLFGNRKSVKMGMLNQCTLCHTDQRHDWKTTGMFDHNTQTRYPISGKHIGVKCEECHKLSQPPTSPQTRVYYFAALPQKTCEVCHASPHKNSFSKAQLAKRCTECHTDQGWDVSAKDGSKFDHSKTRFPLTGKHLSTSCKDCHGTGKKSVYKFKSFEKQFCVDCHKNIHVDQFRPALHEQACSNCHTTRDFKKDIQFDHTRSTRFELTGKHLESTCKDCHQVSGKPLYHFNHFEKKFCVDCHKNVHEDQFSGKFSGKACSECHTTRDFDTRLEFDHSTTAYPIHGKHVGLKCEKCHVKTEAQFEGGAKSESRKVHYKSKFLFPEMKTRECAACHKDVHNGSYGKNCTECHVDDGWSRTSDFHKNFTLSGVHYSLECSECHKDGRKLSGLSQACYQCHKKDDVHNGTLINCGNCHRQQFWDNAEYKHSLTNFPLRGIHRTLDCYSCHNRGTYKGLPATCVSCHLQDAQAFTGAPNHSLLLGRNCAECHNQFTFH